MIELTYTEDDTIKRLDKFIATKLTDNSRSYYQRLIKKGNISINGEVCENQRHTLATDDVIQIKEPEVKENRLVAEDIPLDVLYEDDAILVINKPPNSVVHPAVGNWKGTIINALLHRFPILKVGLPAQRTDLVLFTV
jgi:23S rRNA pseudouridine1911/1915/1917 synthase